MSSVAAPIPATDVGYDGVRLLDLDFERRNERILGLDENVIRLPFEFQPDSELRGHRPLLKFRHMSHSRSHPPPPQDWSHVPFGTIYVKKWHKADISIPRKSVRFRRYFVEKGLPKRRQVGQLCRTSGWRISA